MPHRAPTACSTARCPGHAVGGSGRCASCGGTERRAYDRARGSSSRRGYGARWRKLRGLVLARDAYTCQGRGSDGRRCGRAVAGRDAQVDHIVGRRAGGLDELANLQTLCLSCHSRKTATEGRWGPRP